MEIKGVDINQHAVDTINQGKIHIEEPGLEELVKNAVDANLLKAYTTPQKADAFIMAVPTPFKGENHEPNLDYIESATRSLAKVLEKGNLVKKLYPQQEIQDNVDLYFLLRKIFRAPHDTEQEYRRHVAIITNIDGREEIINIDVITQYLEFEKNFYGFVVNMLKDYAKQKHIDENGWEY